MESLELPLEELVNHLMWVRGTHSRAPVIRKHSEVPSPLPTTHWRRHEQWTPALSRSALARTVDSVVSLFSARFSMALALSHIGLLCFSQRLWIVCLPLYETGG